MKDIYVPRYDCSSDDDLEEEQQEPMATWLRHFEPDELCYRYEPIWEVGRGRYGIIYKGKSFAHRGCLNAGQFVAIKKIRRIFQTRENTNNLLRELTVCRLLRNHDNFIKICDILPPHQKQWNMQCSNCSLTIILEYFPADLSQIFRTNQFFTTIHTQYILYQILCALQYIHSINIAHCQLKPKHIRIDEKCNIKLTKFHKAYCFDPNDNELLSVKNENKKPKLFNDSDDHETKLNKIEKSYLWDVDKEEETRKLIKNKKPREYQEKLNQINESDMTEQDKQKMRNRLRRSRRLKLLLNKKKPGKKKIRTPIHRYVVTKWYKAPEQILSQTKPSKLTATDIWSVGAIFAELLQMQRENCPDPTKRCPLFPGDSCFPLDEFELDYVTRARVDQMQIIFNIIGSPNESEIAKITDETARKYVRNLPQRKKENLKRIFPGSEKQALHLMEQLLKFDMDKRIKIEQALCHSYFSQFVRDKTYKKRNVNHEQKNACADTELFAFENDLDISVNEMKRVILEAVSEYNQDGEGRCILFGAMCEFKLNVVLDGYIRQCIQPLLNINQVIPIEILQLCYNYMDI